MPQIKIKILVSNDVAIESLRHAYRWPQLVTWMTGFVAFTIFHSTESIGNTRPFSRRKKSMGNDAVMAMRCMRFRKRRVRVWSWRARFRHFSP